MRFPALPEARSCRHGWSQCGLGWAGRDAAIGEERHVLGKYPRAAKTGRGNPDDFAAVTQIHLTSVTIAAITAEDSRVESNVVTGLKISRRAAECLNNSRGLMPHDDEWEMSSRASVVSMHVASADATRVNANEQVIFAGLRFCYIDEVELLILRENERLPGLSLQLGRHLQSKEST